MRCPFATKKYHLSIQGIDKFLNYYLFSLIYYLSIWADAPSIAAALSSDDPSTALVGGPPA